MPSDEVLSCARLVVGVKKRCGLGGLAVFSVKQGGRFDLDT